MKKPEPKKDLVLLGGGHTHVLTMRSLYMEQPEGLRITLVSESDFTPYSGMLPGLIAGHYTYQETHIDLRSLCSRLGMRFIRASASAIDPETNAVQLRDRPPLEYDFLSINVGSEPDTLTIPGAVQYATSVKPVSGFYRRWQEIQQRVESQNQISKERLMIVGGGAGSVELALAISTRLGKDKIEIQLVCGGNLLESYNAVAQRAVRTALENHNISLLENHRINRVETAAAFTDQEKEISFNSLLWCTAAAAPKWLNSSNLPRDKNGFLQVEDSLRVIGHRNIFAVGDTAIQVNHPRPRAGVYAVRQAPTLTKNLVRSYQGKELIQHKPQNRFLSLLSLGEKVAVADRGWFGVSGKWVWRWKDHIDRQFMNQFIELPKTMNQPTATALQPDSAAMHCGGCGAKLPPAMLRGVLSDLIKQYPSVINHNTLSDDAAILNFDSGKKLIQSTDSLRQLVDDPWIMGRIAALHALSDLYAMGATPHSCLAHISLPFGSADIQFRDLYLLMSGALHEMDKAGCQLVGGHSLEGEELTIGFTVNGEADFNRVMKKSDVKTGASLILTKPIGSGVLFAAHATGAADGRDIQTCIETMLHSNGEASKIAMGFGVQACTDVTGFGLLVHLQEMLAGADDIQARLKLADIPILEGVSNLFSNGFASTLSPGNQSASMDNAMFDKSCDPDKVAALFDPQTSGGLLLAIESDRAVALLTALHQNGYLQARCIGELVPKSSDDSGVIPSVIVESPGTI